MVTSTSFILILIPAVFTGMLVQLRRANRRAQRSARERDALQATLQAAQVDIALGQATKILVHDIRKPFHQLKVAFGFFQEVKNAEDFERYAKLFRSEIDKAILGSEDIIRDVMEMCQAEGRVVKSHTQISALLNDCVEAARIVAPHDAVHFCVQANSDLFWMVDRARLKRAVTNILLNAIEAMGTEGGKILLDTTICEDTLELSITNTNSFIPSHHLARLFDPGFTSGKRTGAGLGLALVRRFVEEQGGSVSVSCDQSQKTVTFKIILKRNRRSFTRIG